MIEVTKRDASRHALSRALGFSRFMVGKQPQELSAPPPARETSQFQETRLWEGLFQHPLNFLGFLVIPAAQNGGLCNKGSSGWLQQEFSASVEPKPNNFVCCQASGNPGPPLVWPQGVSTIAVGTGMV